MQPFEIDISELDPALVLAALYNAARPVGRGFYRYEADIMSVAEARRHLAVQTYFDYLNGRVMKIEIEDRMDVRGYNDNNGEGAAHMVIQSLQNGDGHDSITTRTIHQYGRSESLQQLSERILDEIRRSGGNTD